jgi:glutamate 5-kinase
MNENDALATEEITFGDNDQLGAMVTGLLKADLYILLSKQEGLFTDNPASNPTAKHLPIAPSEEIANGFINDDLNGISRGGMKSKLKASFNAAASGAHVIMARGQGIIHCLRNLASNDPTYRSTVFLPSYKLNAA